MCPHDEEGVEQEDSTDCDRVFSDSISVIASSNFVFRVFRVFGLESGGQDPGPCPESESGLGLWEGLEERLGRVRGRGLSVELEVELVGQGDGLIDYASAILDLSFFFIASSEMDLSEN